MANPEFFRPKNAEQLTKQVSDVSVILGEFIAQPTIHNESLGLSISDLKEKFPVRYQVYLDVLRNSRKGEEPHVPHARRIHTLNALDRYISTHYSQGEGDRILFDPQMNAFEALRLSLERAAIDGYIRLPTGSGKTVLFTEFVEATDLRTLVVVPTRFLVRQTEEKFEQFAPGVETGKVHSDAKEWGRQVTITTYSSFLRGVENEKINPVDYDLLILDEAHKSLSLRRIAAVQEFADAIKLGFTATPRYSENRHLGNLLNTEIHKMSIREAIEEGLLSSLSVYIAKTDVNLSNVRVTSSGEYNDDDLERAVNITVRNTAAVDLYKAMFLDQIAVAYCVSVKHAEDLANHFNQAGIPAGVVSSHQNYSEQEEVLRRFRSGELKVICNADILIEGFDDPRVAVCLNLRPTASPVVAEQRAGRVLRPDFQNPFKHAYIVDFLDEFGDPNRFPISFAQILEAAHVFRKDTPPEYSRSGTTGIGPVRYPEIEISGLQVITDAEEVMRVVREMVEAKYETAQGGWLTVGAIDRTFRIGSRTLERWLDKYRDTNPEYFKMLRDPINGRIREYIAPELVEIVKTTRETLKAPVEGWISSSKLAAELELSLLTLDKIVNAYRADSAQYFRLFKIEGGQYIEHFSPELTDMIRTYAKERFPKDPSPEAYVGYQEAADTLGIEHSTVRRFAERYKKTNPEYFTRRKGRGFKGKGAPGEAISKHIVILLKAELDKISSVEEGWLPPSVLASEFKNLGVTKAVVKGIASQYRRDHPEFFRESRADDGKISEHYSPGFAELLRTKITELTQPLESGWMPTAAAAEVLGLDSKAIYHGRIKKRLDQYRKTYPNSFRRFLDPAQKSHKVVECIAPEVSELIKINEGVISTPEDGWMNSYEIEKQFGIKRGKIRQFIKQFRDQNPQYFKVLRSRSRHVGEYLSPELVDFIKNEFLEAESLPQGWVNYQDLTGTLGLSRKAIMRMTEQYQKDHADSFKQYRGNNNAWTYFMSPELAEELKQANLKVSDLEPGWLNRTNIARELKIPTSKIAEFVESLRDNNPSYFRFLRGGKNQRSEHYSPELVEKIREHFRK